MVWHFKLHGWVFNQLGPSLYLSWHDNLLCGGVELARVLSLKLGQRERKWYLKCLVNTYVTLRCEIKASRWTRTVKRHIEIIQKLQWVFADSLTQGSCIFLKPYQVQGEGKFSVLGQILSVRMGVTNRTTGTDQRQEGKQVFKWSKINKLKTPTRNKTRRNKERKENEWKKLQFRLTKKQILNKVIMCQTLCWGGKKERRVKMLPNLSVTDYLLIL